MSKGRIRSKKTSASNPFDASTHKTERTGVAVLMHWMREIIQKHQLDLGLPDVETSGADRKMPDVVLYESRRSQQVLCLFEAKLPYFNVFNEEELKEPARRKATERRAKYFVTLNFKRLIWYKTEDVNALKPDQIVGAYLLSEIEKLDDLEATRYSEPIKRNLEEFLLKLYAVHTNAEPEPKKAIDESLVLQLQEKIKTLSYYYRQTIEDQARKDAGFLLKLQKWFADQNWQFSWSPTDFDKAARQTSYLLVNKVLFYDVLQARRPHELDPLDIPASLTKGSRLQATLQSYFSEALKIDYETIFTTDFIDAIAFPDAREVIREIKELVTALSRYNFLQIGFDIIGRIFERLIPSEERHNLGQYFTSADVVDLVLRFCLQHEDDKVLDPSCGAGTFLVRAYQHKKLMNQRKQHEEILETLWGNDIAKFPAHLATINLAINDLSQDRNYPNVSHEDFFKLQVGPEGFEAESLRKAKAKTLGVEERSLIYPRYFDCVVGNPPYTRQEEISEISPDVAKYKENLINGALRLGNEQLANISGRAGLHAYFFVHGMKFLREGGRFGFVVPSAWLDTDYGRGLQEFFLQYYKIIAIIESKVERWFEEADVNTCIVLLEKCSDEQARNEHLARFVYLKKPLRHFIPPAQDLWEKQVERLDAIDALRRTILAHSDVYENDELCIFPKPQKELWAEGCDVEKARYVGARWGKYLRAPKIFFRIMEKSKGKLVPLKEAATVRNGIKTGANKFFHLTTEKAASLGIEQEFLQPVIHTLKKVKGYSLNKADLTRCIIICNKIKEELRETKLLDYIKQGEELGYHERRTCASRGRDSWYMLGKNWNYSPLIFPAKVGERMPVFLNAQVFEDKKSHGITPKDSDDVLVLAGLLNSTLSRFFIEFSARQLTGSQAYADIDLVVVKELLIPYARKAFTARVKKQIEKAFEKLAQTPAESVFKEIAPASSEVSLDRVKAERRELDRIIMSEVLGLSEDEQLEVYRAVVDLVRTRLDKAKSFGKRTKLKDGVDVEKLKKALIEEYDNGE